MLRRRAAEDTAKRPGVGPSGKGTPQPALPERSALLEEANASEEMCRYIGWLRKVSPGAAPTSGRSFIGRFRS